MLIFFMIMTLVVWPLVCFTINHSWDRFCGDTIKQWKESNNDWADLCAQQNREWGDFCRGMIGVAKTGEIKKASA